MKLQKTNVILINCDDMGYGDLGCYGSPVNHTPFLDRMAEEGMRFTSCYSPSPVCSPSRAALMTGCYPPRVGINRVLFPGEALGLNPEEFTLPQLFKNAGYHTMIVGKWHCGDQQEFLPCKFGFDDYFGLPYSNDMGRQAGKNEYNPPLPLISGDEVIQQQPDQRGLTERYTEQSIRFIRSHADEPFFLYFAQMHVHLPLYAADRFCKESENGDFGACVAEVDWSCASIAAELKRLGIYENTLLLFTSDNGSRGDHGASNAPLRGGKFTTWEGGQRVPLIAHWHGHIPAGTVNDGIISHIDFLPTFAALTGEKLSGNVIDGINQLDTFFDPEIHLRDCMAYFGSNNGTAEERAGYFNAFRVGDWKLHFRVNGEECSLLYNLRDDIGETEDLSEHFPEIVKQISDRADELRNKLGDQGRLNFGTECRPAGKVENPVPLTYYDENHPYIVALYDKDDIG